jgi:hypothetical protein
MAVMARTIILGLITLVALGVILRLILDDLGVNPTVSRIARPPPH